MRKRDYVRVALVQMNATVGDLQGNTEKIAQGIKRAREERADIVAFPELALCGYPPEDLLLKKHFIADMHSCVRSLVKESTDIMVILGCVDRDAEGHLYNAAAIMAQRTLYGMYHKMHLPNYGVFDEKRYFTPGKENKIFVIGEKKFGVNICEDIWHESGVIQSQIAAGVGLIINISASPFYAGKRTKREDMLVSRTRAGRLPVCYLNLVGGQDELIFDGGSFIYDATGKKIAEGKQLEEDIIYADIRIPVHQRKKVPGTMPPRYVELPDYPKYNRKPLKRRSFVPLSHRAELYNALVLGTRDYVVKNGFKDVVIGLSGGIDSALTAAIACDALGSEHVIGVSMPTQFSSKGTRTDAERLARNLGMRLLTIPIQDLFESYTKLLRPIFHGLKPNEAEENIQARIRGTILMALSNKFGWLVLTTGNKSETACGYCTLYGDMAGGFAVIKDVSKTCVYELSRYYNKRVKGRGIPESIIRRPPTAELRFNQKDQDTLPPYEVLDPIINAYIEHDKSAEEIEAPELSPVTVRTVLRMIDRNEYKRRQAPPGIKITPKAFGRDRRLPITNRYITDKECRRKGSLL